MQKKQKKEQVQREGVGTSLARMLLLPESSLTGSVRIECNANREAVVEGCSGILEYSDETIRLTTGRMVLRFTGRGLSKQRHGPWLCGRDRKYCVNRICDLRVMGCFC